jgi:hypothetical protein
LNEQAEEGYQNKSSIEVHFSHSFDKLPKL